MQWLLGLLYLEQSRQQNSKYVAYTFYLNDSISSRALVSLGLLAAVIHCECSHMNMFWLFFEARFCTKSQLSQIASSSDKTCTTWIWSFDSLPTQYQFSCDSSRSCHGEIQGSLGNVGSSWLFQSNIHPNTTRQTFPTPLLSRTSAPSIWDLLISTVGVYEFCKWFSVAYMSSALFFCCPACTAFTIFTFCSAWK